MQQNQPGHFGFLFSAIAIAILSFGLVMLVFCLAYTRDLATLVNAPFAVWNALCGVPTDDPLNLAILLTTSLMAVVVSVGMLLANHFLVKRYRGM